MIGASIQFLAMQLNLHLRQIMSVREDVVAISRKVGNDEKEFKDSFSGDRAVVLLKVVFSNLYFLLADKFKSEVCLGSLRSFLRVIGFYLWGTVGAKYVPSVLYRQKTVALGGNYSYYQPYVVRFLGKTELGVL